MVIKAIMDLKNIPMARFIKEDIGTDLKKAKAS